jgi:hypothetical protein
MAVTHPLFCVSTGVRAHPVHTPLVSSYELMQLDDKYCDWPRMDEDVRQSRQGVRSKEGNTHLELSRSITTRSRIFKDQENGCMYLIFHLRNRIFNQ